MLVAAAPGERAFLEAFFLDIYTARAHNDGTVAAFVDEVVAFPHKQSPEVLHRFLDAFLEHDPTARPELGRAVAAAIPGARFEVQEGESHQPFQEVPDRWNARVDAFWREVEAAPAGLSPAA